ncbi:hypothetical protein L596_006527 [Steinernema carpocapsae]|uniref:Uncharacterized protein n=1 Tax=Steinernema carpocapsae TaxID=34508 RepID=A0A4U8V4K3_STECR|nr:hypothetical protein L596_006527 [Steinernema carpocapsae]
MRLRVQNKPVYRAAAATLVVLQCSQSVSQPTTPSAHPAKLFTEIVVVGWLKTTVHALARTIIAAQRQQRRQDDVNESSRQIAISNATSLAAYFPDFLDALPVLCVVIGNWQ